VIEWLEHSPLVLKILGSKTRLVLRIFQQNVSLFTQQRDGEGGEEEWCPTSVKPLPIEVGSQRATSLEVIDYTMAFTFTEGASWTLSSNHFWPAIWLLDIVCDVSALV